jgi:hypothetical protein
MNQPGDEITVQDSQPRSRKLTLARETLRSLGDATLARAAGGTLFVEAGPVFEQQSTQPGCHTSPWDCPETSAALDPKAERVRKEF